MLRHSAVLLAGMMVLATSLQAEGPRRDGRWEVKVEMQMAGRTMPAQTVQQCVTKEEAADPQKAYPQGGPGGSSQACKVSDYKVDGNKVTWSVSCDEATGAGEFTYSGDTFTGTMKMSVRGQEITMKHSGKRLGDCTK